MITKEDRLSNVQLQILPHLTSIAADDPRHEEGVRFVIGTKSYFSNSSEISCSINEQDSTNLHNALSHKDSVI